MTMITSRTMIAAIVSTTVLTACTTIASETRISTRVAASEYNDVASRYMERPTFASIQSLSDGQDVLRLEMDSYGSGINPTTGFAANYTLPFDKRFGADYLALIDKYVEWERLARERGDLIDREIGSAPTWSSLGGTGSLKFSIFSSSANAQMLVVSYCVSVGCSDQAFTFSRVNALELRKLLADFTDGRIGGANLDAVYR